MPPEPSAALLARGLVKTYRDGTGELRVLEGIDFDLAPGEIVAVVGRSGCGKSTLLHLLGLLDRPTGGALRVAGREASSLSERGRASLRRRWLGFVFQHYHLLADFTALENVMSSLALARGGGFGADNRRRALLALEHMGLAERAKARPSELSGGERQRVAAARALAHEPMALLCDEPTGNLDPDTGALALELLRRAVRERNASMVLVTHEAEVARAADRILRMDNGRLFPAGPYQTGEKD